MFGDHFFIFIDFQFQIREISLAILISMVWFILFVVGYIFPLILENLGITVCMITFGFVCILNAIFCAVFVPETRGKSYEEILDIMTK